MQHVRIVGQRGIGDVGALQGEHRCRILVAHEGARRLLELGQAVGSDGLQQAEALAPDVRGDKLLARAPALDQGVRAQERFVFQLVGQGERVVERELALFSESLQAAPCIAVREVVVEAAPAAPSRHVARIGQQVELRVRHERAGAGAVARVAAQTGERSGQRHGETALLEHLLRHERPALVGHEHARAVLVQVLFAVEQNAQVLRDAVQLVFRRRPLDGHDAVRRLRVARDARFEGGIHVALVAKPVGERGDGGVAVRSGQREHGYVAAASVELHEALGAGERRARGLLLVGVAARDELAVGQQAQARLLGAAHVLEVVAQHVGVAAAHALARVAAQVRGAQAGRFLRQHGAA